MITANASALIGFSAAVCYVAIIVSVLLQGGTNAMIYLALLLLVPTDLCLILVSSAMKRRRR